MNPSLKNILQKLKMEISLNYLQPDQILDHRIANFNIVSSGTPREGGGSNFATLYHPAPTSNLSRLYHDHNCRPLIIFGAFCIISNRISNYILSFNLKLIYLLTNNLYIYVLSLMDVIQYIRLSYKKLRTKETAY